MSVIISPTYRPHQDTMYAKNTVPELLVLASENISVQLKYWSYADRENADWGDADVVFTGSYAPDFLGEIRLDFSELYGTFIKTTMPAAGQTFVDQAASIGYFRLFIADSNGDPVQDSTLKWFVANAVINSGLPFQTWSQLNFLTNQPLEKPTDYDSREYITYLDLEGDWNLVARFYPKEGGMVDAVPRSDTGEGCFTVDVSYARLIPMVARLPHQLKGYYDIILTDGNLDEICRQRYIYNERTGKEHYFLFTNALGGIDTMICLGENVLQPETMYNIGRFDKKHVPLNDTDDTRLWSQQIGLVPHRWRNWVNELLSCKQDAALFNADDDTITPIVLTGSDVAMGDSGQMASASFTYMLAVVGNVMADTERALDRSLHQSVADEAEEMEDISTKRTLVFVDTGSGYETEEIEIPAPKLYVEFEQPGDAERNETIYYSIDGELAGDFTPGTDASPVVITMKEGQTIQFTSQELSVELLELSYYPNTIQSV